jgi:hypothetical protein
MIITCRELAGRMTALSQTAVEEFILDKYGSNEAVRVRLRQCMGWSYRVLQHAGMCRQANTHHVHLQEMRDLVLDSNVAADLKSTLRALGPICDAIYSIEQDK